MKKRLTIVACLVFIICVLSAMFIGCEPDKRDPLDCLDLTIEGDFAYEPITLEEKEGVCIVTLSLQGRQKERIDIPTHLGGKPVLFVGKEKNRMYGAPMEVYYFGATKLKKVVIGYSEDCITSDCGYRRLAIIPYVFRPSIEPFQLEKLIWCNSTNAPYNIEAYPTLSKKICYPRLLRKDSFVANIQYLYNFENADNKGICYIDDMEEGESLFEPPYIPQRKDYNFVGWYKEAECENKWDFEKEIKGKEDIQLFAKWGNRRKLQTFCLFN